MADHLSFTLRYGLIRVVDESGKEYGSAKATDEFDAGPSHGPWRLERLVDVALGLLRIRHFATENEDGTTSYGHDDAYLNYLFLWYPSEFTSTHGVTGTAELGGQVFPGPAFPPPERLLQLGLQFERAVASAAHGVFDAAELGAHLGAIQHTGRGTARMAAPQGFWPFPSLCTLALQELLRRGPLKPRPCINCGLPWLGARGNPQACFRPAIGRLTACAKVTARDRFRERNPEFFRERAKLYERVRRGTLQLEIYHGWREANSPGEKGEAWASFEDWQAGKRPKGETQKKKTTKKKARA